jgi:hypothetical protein
LVADLTLLQKNLKNTVLYQAQKLSAGLYKQTNCPNIPFLFEWLGDSNRKRRELDGFRRLIVGYLPVDFGDMKMVSERVVVSLIFSNDAIAEICETIPGAGHDHQQSVRGVDED